MRRKTLLYALEDDAEKDDHTPAGDNPNTDDSVGNLEDLDLNSGSNDSNTDDSEDKTFDPGPLNVDLVYRLKELETNNKTDTEEYNVLKRLMDKRNEDNADDQDSAPAALEIKAAQFIKDDQENDGDDLLEDESVSTPNDYDDEQFTRFESTDMSIESYQECLSLEGHYTNDANSYMLNNLQGSAKSAGRNMMVMAGVAGKGISKSASVAGMGASMAGRSAAKIGSTALSGGKSLIALGYNGIKSSITALDKFYERHNANFTKIEKELAYLRKNVFLLKEIDNRKPYTKTRVIDNIINEKNSNIKSLLINQIKFYDEFSKIVISSLKNQEEITSNLLEFATNQELKSLTLKNYTSKRLIETISVRSDIESIDGQNSHLVEVFNSKEILMGNRTLVSVLPSKNITSIEDYIEAMKLSKVAVYKLNSPVVTELKVPNKRDLLEIIDLAITLTRHLKDSKSELNKIIGIKRLLLGLYKHFDIISTTEYFISTDKKTRKEISQYLKVSSQYMDHVYIDPFINIKNYYYNSLKYFTHYVKDICRR